MKVLPKDTASASPASSTCCAVSRLKASLAISTPPKRFFKSGLIRFSAQRFAGENEGDAALAQLLCQIAEGG